MLQAELSVLKHNQPRIHELSSYLMLSDVDEIARVTKSHLGSKATDDQARLDLMHRLQVWYFVTKIVLTYCEKNCSSDREKLLKFEGEGRGFAKIL